jgi:hypothetical protein
MMGQSTGHVGRDTTGTASGWSIGNTHHGSMGAQHRDGKRTGHDDMKETYSISLFGNGLTIVTYLGR